MKIFLIFIMSITIAFGQNGIDGKFVLKSIISHDIESYYEFFPDKTFNYYHRSGLNVVASKGTFEFHNRNLILNSDYKTPKFDSIKIILLDTLNNSLINEYSINDFNMTFLKFFDVNRNVINDAVYIKSDIWSIECYWVDDYLLVNNPDLESVKYINIYVFNEKVHSIKTKTLKNHRFELVFFFDREIPLTNYFYIENKKIKLRKNKIIVERNVYLKE